MTNNGELQELAKTSVAQLLDFFAKEKKSEDHYKTAGLAMRALSTWVRLLQVQSSNENRAFRLASRLAEDREQLKAYIQATMPNYLPVPKE